MEDARHVGRRGFVRKLGALSVTGALGASALSQSASAAGDGADTYQLTIKGREIPVRIIKHSAMAGEAQVKMDGEWKEVVQRFEGFVNVEDEYLGVKFDVTENVETVGKLTLAALIMGIAASIPTEGASAFASGALTTFAAGLMTNFANVDQFTIGTR